MHRISVQMTISLPPDLYKKAMAVAKEELRTKSELVREALRSYVGRHRLVNQARRQLAKNLDKKGIKSLADIERMVDEGR